MTYAEITADLFAIQKGCANPSAIRQADTCEADAYARFLGARAGVVNAAAAGCKLDTHSFNRREMIFTGATFECGTYVAFPGAEEMIKGVSVGFELVDEDGNVEHSSIMFFKGGKVAIAACDADLLKAANKAFVAASKAASKAATRKPRAKAAKLVKQVDETEARLRARIAELEAAIAQAKADTARIVKASGVTRSNGQVFDNVLPEIVYLMADPYIEGVHDTVEEAWRLAA